MDNLDLELELLYACPPNINPLLMGSLCLDRVSCESCCPGVPRGGGGRRKAESGELVR